jgi:eukaryotic-like serine/threonine-protein kinase
VPNVKGKSLRGVKQIVVRAHCRVGEIRRAYSNKVEKGRVISETPKPGKVLPKGGKVNLVVSRGRKG